ncbi:MAG: hypothetical protein OEV00_07290 [Acidobacteriota bacterium]|nr:hypothetical protein [Acidobacteriota bacterium]MDH3785117.1 hypothetical protein [Acidobacteriota bacterium]
MPALSLLGPQRFQPTVGPALDALDGEGALALISAGWQERESEVDELREHVGREVVNLRLYARTERVLRRDPELATALQERQAQLRELQRYYRQRLNHGLDAARELQETPQSDAHRFHQRAAIHAVRELDRQHLVALTEVHDEFESRWNPGDRPEVARHRREIRRALRDCAALGIAGGHVAVLLTRMRLLIPKDTLKQHTILAWSAGAMALGARIVLFHDHPPQGPGNPEVFDQGLGIYGGLVPLPHAARRLRLDDPVRVGLFARRFTPDLSVAFDDGGRVDRENGGWNVVSGARILHPEGDLREVGS